MAVISTRDYVFRPATFEDSSILKSLRSASVTQLCRDTYTSSQISAILTPSRDNRYDDLISCGNYFVLTAPNDPTQIVASAGWTLHRTQTRELSAVPADESLDPNKDSAWIRGMYVHPDHARRGLAIRLIRECEANAKQRARFVNFRLSATMNAVSLYEKCGYIKVEEDEGLKVIAIANGETIATVLMVKTINNS